MQLSFCLFDTFICHMTLLVLVMQTLNTVFKRGMGVSEYLWLHFLRLKLVLLCFRVDNKAFKGNVL